MSPAAAKTTAHSHRCSRNLSQPSDAELFSRRRHQRIRRHDGTQPAHQSDVLESSRGVHPCPAFIACYHEKFGTLCYTNAGHTPGFSATASGISELGSTGLPLAVFPRHVRGSNHRYRERRRSASGISRSDRVRGKAEAIHRRVRHGPRQGSFPGLLSSAALKPCLLLS